MRTIRIPRRVTNLARKTIAKKRIRPIPARPISAIPASSGAGEPKTRNPKKTRRKENRPMRFLREESRLFPIRPSPDESIRESASAAERAATVATMRPLPDARRSFRARRANGVVIPLE